MENSTFKCVAFGGFDKQDVIRYIEQSAREAAEVREQLQLENERLRTESADLQAQVRALQEKLEAESSLREDAQSRLEQAKRALEDLRTAKADADRLTAEVERLRPDAEAYVRFRNRIGDIECAANKRAAELESTTTARLRRTTDLFRSQYTDLMSSFEAAAAHVISELRKVEVNLTQLPRAMDQTGAELNELSALLEQGPEQKGT